MNRHITRPERSPLPTTYVEAKTALGKCVRVDECKTWADKALALKSYAKQMKDSSLEDMAQRIRDRAMRRGGELLQALETARGKGKASDKSVRAGARPNSRKAAAKKAGLSPHQAKQMVRIAGVPEDQFELMVEAPKPATTDQLAEIGTQKREKPKPWEHSNTWIEWISAIRHLSTLPSCGLSILAARQYRDKLIAECEAAMENLKLWHAEVTAAEENGYAIDNDGNIRRDHPAGEGEVLASEFGASAATRDYDQQGAAETDA